MPQQTDNITITTRIQTMYEHTGYDSFILFYFFWQAHNICVPLTNKVYRYVQKTNRKGEEQTPARHT